MKTLIGTLGSLLTVVMLVTTVPAHAAPGSARYDVSFGSPPLVGGVQQDVGAPIGRNIGGVRFEAAGVRPFALRVADDASALIPGFFACQDANGDTFCGSGWEAHVQVSCSNTGSLAVPANEPQFDPALPIYVMIYTVWPGESSARASCRTAAATSGSVTITYADIF